MPSLAELQQQFREAVITGEVQRAAPAALIGGHEPSKRLAVHARNYETSLVEALLVKFPATGWLIGTPFLREAARRFVHEHPPQGPCIAEYGAGFPNFLSNLVRARLPYIRDFSELEWYVGQVAIAVNSPSVDAGEFSTIDAARLPDTTLKLQPGLRYLDLEWPVDDLLKLYLTETVPDQFELTRARAWIEVRGARGEFHLNRFDRGEFTFRKSISHGRSVGDAAEHALDVNSKFDPGQALAGLIAAGLITAINRGQSKEED